MFKIEYSRNALKSLKALPKDLCSSILNKIEQLAANPREAANVKKLTGRPGYRLRVGDWRVIFEI